MTRMTSKIVSLFLCLLLVGTSSAERTFSSLRRQQELESFARNVDVSSGEVDVSALQITDEREGQAFCSLLFTLFEETINDLSPVPFGCSCNLRILKARVEFSCDTTVCVDDIEELAEVALNLPLVGGYCVTPTFGGIFRVIRQQIEGKLCSGSEDAILNVSAIEEIFGFAISEEETMVLQVPNVCADVVTTEGGELTSLSDCHVTVDGKDCPCEVCGETGQDVSLNCTDVLAEYVPEILEPFLEVTTLCIGMGLFETEDEDDGTIPLTTPLFQLKVPEGAQ